MANNYWVLTQAGYDVFRCKDCGKYVKSLSHECDDIDSIFSDEEMEVIKNNG